MKNRLSALLAAFLLMCPLFSGCTGDSSHSQTLAPAQSIMVYRVVKEEYRSGGELLRAEEIPLGSDADALHAMLVHLADQPADNQLLCPLPEGTEILYYSLTDGEIILTLSSGYLELSGMDKTMVDYCLTLTLAALSEVDAVSIYVEGQPVTLGMTADDAVLYDTETNPYEKQVRLYFTDSSGRYLCAEYHSLTVSEDTDIERVVMDELLRGPYDEELRSSIPPGTALISVSTVDGLCTVDLSQDFYSRRSTTALGERLAIYSVVNSLTSLTNVDEVRILIGGARYDKYRYISLAEPLVRNSRAIGPANSARGETELELVSVMNSGELVSMPTVVVRDEVVSLEQTAVENLISLEPEPGYRDLFSGEDEVVSAETRNGVCTVILNREFFDSRAESEDAELSAWVIVATLTQMDGVDSVKLVCRDGGAVSLGSLDLSANLTLPRSISVIH